MTIWAWLCSILNGKNMKCSMEDVFQKPNQKNPNKFHYLKWPIHFLCTIQYVGWVYKIFNCFDMQFFFFLCLSTEIFFNKTNRDTNYITDKAFCGPRVIMCVAYDLLFPPATTSVAHWSERSPFIGLLIVNWCREEAVASRKKRVLSYLLWLEGPMARSQ